MLTEVNKITFKIYHNCTHGDFSGLVLDGEPSPKQLLHAYEQLQRGIFDNFGASNEYIAYLRDALQAARLYAEAYTKEGQYYKVTLAEVKELQAKQHLEGVRESKLHELETFASKKMGFQVRADSTPVLLFISYLRS